MKPPYIDKPLCYKGITYHYFCLDGQHSLLFENSNKEVVEISETTLDELLKQVAFHVSKETLAFLSLSLKP